MQNKPGKEAAGSGNAWHPYPVFVRDALQESMSDKIKTKAEILESINALKEELKKKEAELDQAEAREYREELDGFLKRFNLRTSDDVRRLRSVLEGIEGFARNSASAPPSGADTPEENADGKDAVSREPEEEASPQGLEELSEYSPDEKESEPEFDWTALAAENMAGNTDNKEVHDDQQEEAAGADASEDVPEPVNSGKAEEDPFGIAYSSLVGQDDEGTTSGPEGKDEPATEAEGNNAAASDQEEEYDPFKAIMEAFSNEDGKTPDDLTSVLDSDFDIPVDRDTTGIDPAMIVANISTDATVAKYKDRAVVVDAEKKLLEAISAAVYEGWVRRDEVLDRFFRGGNESENIYNMAQELCDNLEAVWSDAGANGSASEEKLKEFQVFPFHVKCKAIVCAMSDLKDYLGN